MYAGRDLAKTCRALTGLAGNKRVNEKRKGRSERKREREREGKGMLQNARWIAPLSILMYCPVRTESTALT